MTKTQTAKKKAYDQPAMILKRNGYEVWLKYDESADVFEAFASEDGSDYIGCFDTVAEAKVYAAKWISEQNA